jgi:RimJ/RimL family protein N-acetyltransferase
MQIFGRLVKLRAIEKSDIPYLHSWANNPLIHQGIGEIHFPTSIDFHFDWFERTQNEKQNLRLIIETNNGQVIGLNSLMNIDLKHGHAWYGITLGDEAAHGAGFALDAVRATMRYSFEELKLERLDGGVMESNTKSLNLFCSKLVGWETLGTRENYFYREGKFQNQVLIGITSRQHLTLEKSTNYWSS